jgi:hypothetical protein
MESYISLYEVSHSQLRYRSEPSTGSEHDPLLVATLAESFFCVREQDEFYLVLSRKSGTFSDGLYLAFLNHFSSDHLIESSI